MTCLFLRVPSYYVNMSFIGNNNEWWNNNVNECVWALPFLCLSSSGPVGSIAHFFHLHAFGY